MLLSWYAHLSDQGPLSLHRQTCILCAHSAIPSISVYTYLRFGGRNGVHLHIFEIWGPEWCPLTHISNMGAGMVSIYTYFKFGVRNGVRLHIFQFWVPDMVSVYTYLRFGSTLPRCCLINSVNRSLARVASLSCQSRASCGILDKGTQDVGPAKRLVTFLRFLVARFICSVSLPTPIWRLID